MGIIRQVTGNGQVDQVKLSFLRWLREQDSQRRRRYKLFREFYEGDHQVELTDRMREFLQIGGDIEFKLNFCPVPVDTLAERLVVENFDVKDEMVGDDGGDAEKESLTGHILDWWTRNRMDATQKDVHTTALKQGDAYLITEWDNEAGMPRWHFQFPYDEDGGAGVDVAYDSGTGEVAWAVKYWRVEEGPGAGATRRANVYLPDEVRKFSSRETDGGGSWQEIDSLPWTDKQGRPLGVPVTHFRPNAGGYNYGRSELTDVVPIQRAMNKALVDLLAAADVEGFRLLTLSGGEPGDATVAPGQILWIQNDKGKWGSIPPGNLQQLASTVDHFVTKVAQVSRTPLAYFQVTGQVASAETQKADDTGLVAKAEDRAVGLGNAWEDAVHMAVKLHNAFGPGGLNEDLQIETIWDSFERVDKIETERKRSEIALNWVNAGATLEGAATMAGVTEEELELLLNSEQVDGIRQ